MFEVFSRSFVYLQSNLGMVILAGLGEGEGNGDFFFNKVLNSQVFIKCHDSSSGGEERE